jgi:hypothetical protein
MNEMFVEMLPDPAVQVFAASDLKSGPVFHKTECKRRP